MFEEILFFLVLIILLPATGFFISIAFFSDLKKDLGVLERVVFSFLLGIIFPSLFLLVENQVFGIPITFFSSIATIIALIIVSLGIFYYKKKVRQ